MQDAVIPRMQNVTLNDLKCFLCHLQFTAAVSWSMENLIAGSALPLTSSETPPQPFKQLGRDDAFFQTVELPRTFV